MAAGLRSGRHFLVLRQFIRDLKSGSIFAHEDMLRGADTRIIVKNAKRYAEFTYRAGIVGKTTVILRAAKPTR